MKLVCISDTHNLHRHYGRSPFGNVPIGDVIIHAGDVTTHGTMQELETFLQWFVNLPHFHKIFIGGNHDRCLDTQEGRLRMSTVSGAFYLQASGVEIDGVRFWGSPYTPKHQDFAFQLSDNEHAKNHWSSIPEETDVLITHGPPFSILDYGAHAGCPELLERLAVVHPKLHIFGHDHAAYGLCLNNRTLFVNASVHSWLWKQTRPMHPHVIEI